MADTCICKELLQGFDVHIPVLICELSTITIAML